MNSKRQPLFSIVIPTRNRAHLLPYALNSALEQTFDDYEIVVVANNCTDDTQKIVNSYHDNRVRYFETSTTLSMPDNWEFAWTKAVGKYVLYLPDDDAIIPTALEILAQHALSDDPEIVSWEDAIYYYPNWSDQKIQNILLLFNFGETLLEDIPSSVYLNQLKQFDFQWSSPLPKLLNCIANREFFENWRRRLGRLFFPIAPDYSFGWISSHICSKIRVLHRPLSIRGISDFSIGSNAGLGEAGQEFLREFGDFDFFKETQLNLPLSLNYLAATFLRANTALAQNGVQTNNLNKESYILGLARQLQESRTILKNWDAHKDKLLEFAKNLSSSLSEQALSLIEMPIQIDSNTETLRELHQRTARMAREYAGNLQIAATKHSGDEFCGACTLALKEEILVEPNWKYLYIFGDSLGVHDPYGHSKHVDYYYDLLQKCAKKRGTSSRGLSA